VQRAGAEPSRIVVLTVETNRVELHAVELNGGSAREVSSGAFDTKAYLTDKSGRRLIEELFRRVRSFCADGGFEANAVAVSLPGTLDGVSTVQKSSRLGIRQEIDLGPICQDMLGLPGFVFHDVECLGYGEAAHGVLAPVSQTSPAECFAYILVDEGVGCALFVDGKPHRGNGSAGHIGRMVVEPDGTFNRSSQSRGSLEVYAARPWVSHNIVAEFCNERGKGGWEKEGYADFRRRVATLADSQDWDQISCEQIARALEQDDPIVVSVIEEAARYLGVAINALITIANPPSIVLGGSMVEAIPGLRAKITSYARRYSWELAWNRTNILVAKLGRSAQVHGAAELARRSMGAIS